jgi:hypothetical protein
MIQEFVSTMGMFDQLILVVVMAYGIWTGFRNFFITVVYIIRGDANQLSSTTAVEFADYIFYVLVIYLIYSYV